MGFPTVCHESVKNRDLKAHVRYTNELLGAVYIVVYWVTRELKQKRFVREEYYVVPSCT